MSLPTRPNVDDFIEIMNELADVKFELANLEWTLEQFRASAIKVAMDAGAKTRAIDYVKVIGNSDSDKKYIDGLNNKIINLKRLVIILNGKAEGWKAEKDIYRTDSYHQVGARGIIREEDE